MQQSFQVLYDLVVNRLDDEWNHNLSPLTNFKSQNEEDNGFMRHTLQSTEISSQRLVENMQGDKDKSDISVSWHAGHTQQMCNCLN